MRKSLRRSLLVALLIFPLGAASGAELLGSRSSMAHQHSVAVQEDYSFLRTPAQVRRLADEGALVRVEPNDDFGLSGVSFPYARPEVRAFVTRLAASYREETGAKLVVTSLMRPEELQPRNAHALSVHPAGMAVDLRVPEGSTTRGWLERALLAMERAGVLDATRERRPPHYHVAVFPEAFRAYAAREDSLSASKRALELARAAVAPKGKAIAAAQPAPKPDGSPLPGVLLGAVAVLGVTAPVVRRARRRRASAKDVESAN
jgi:hypothetical protein